MEPSFKTSIVSLLVETSRAYEREGNYLKAVENLLKAKEQDWEENAPFYEREAERLASLLKGEEVASGSTEARYAESPAEPQPSHAETADGFAEPTFTVVFPAKAADPTERRIALLEEGLPALLQGRGILGKYKMLPNMHDWKEAWVGNVLVNGFPSIREIQSEVSAYVLAENVLAAFMSNQGVGFNGALSLFFTDKRLFASFIKGAKTTIGFALNRKNYQYAHVLYDDVADCRLFGEEQRILIILKNNEQRVISYDGRYIDGERLFSLVRNVIFA